MITGQSKAFHLGRWELLFKIMDEGSITRVADIENLQRSQFALGSFGEKRTPTDFPLEVDDSLQQYFVGKNSSGRRLRHCARHAVASLL